MLYEGVKLVIGRKFEIGNFGKWGGAMRRPWAWGDHGRLWEDVQVDGAQHRGGPAAEAGDLLGFSSSVCQSRRCPWRQGGHCPLALALELDKFFRIWADGFGGE